ncbi:unnamed protein product, partial [Symbiodinium necroappetens]
MEPDFASPEEDAGDQQVTFQDAELMNEARIVGEGPSPSFYLDMGQTIVEVVVISSDFAPQGCSEPMTLLALPGKALGRRKGAQAGHRASLTVPVTGPLDALDVGLKVDVGVFTVVDSLLGEDELPDPGADTFSFLDAVGNPLRSSRNSGLRVVDFEAAGCQGKVCAGQSCGVLAAFRTQTEVEVYGETSGATFAGRSQVGRVRCRRSFCAGDLGCFGPRGHAQTLLNAIPPALPAAPLDDGLGLGELADKSLALQAFRILQEFRQPEAQEAQSVTPSSPAIVQSSGLRSHRTYGAKRCLGISKTGVLPLEAISLTLPLVFLEKDPVMSKEGDSFNADLILTAVHRLKQKFLSLCILAPLMYADLRAGFSSELQTVDASSEKIAVVKAEEEELPAGELLEEASTPLFEGVELFACGEFLVNGESLCWIAGLPGCLLSVAAALVREWSVAALGVFPQ